MAWALAVILGAIALALAVRLISTRSKLTAQYGTTAAAESAAAAAASRAAEAEAASATAATRAADLAAASEADATTIEALRADLDAATSRASRAERDRAVDPDVLWGLERARSERTWRFSVAVDPSGASALRDGLASETSRVLVEALRIELDAAREDVGAVVELDAEVPDGVAPAGAIIALRIAQELLADVVRRSEETTLRVRAEADDLLITVIGRDGDGNPVTPAPLPLPPSPSVEVDASGATVRVVGAAAVHFEGSPTSTDLDTTREILAPDPHSAGLDEIDEIGDPS